MSLSLPTLDTERLRLRSFSVGDAPDIQRLAGDWAVAEMTTNIPHPYEDGMAEAWLATHPGLLERGEAWCWAVTLRDGGALVGAMSLFNMKAGHQAEMGYWIGRPYWGQGYCTEAGAAVLQQAFDAMGLIRVYALHLDKNPASGRVLEKLGMTRGGLMRSHLISRGKPHDVIQYGVLSEDPR